tara:strand:+ start:713 stop:865 length:153 start_codon:yes stop_codon:yes gene_type:complete
MSRPAKLTLAGTSLFAIATVFFVHYGQQAEKAVRIQNIILLQIFIWKHSS